MAGLERPEHLAGLEVERPEDAVAAPGEAQPACRRRHAAPLRLGCLDLPDAAARVDVDRADGAMVAPAREHLPEVAVRKPEEDVAEHALALLLRRRQLHLDVDGRRLGRAVEDVVRLRVVRRGGVVDTAERRGEDGHLLARLEPRVLGAVDDLDPLVDRLAGPGVVGEPDALHRGDGDDPALLAADLPRVDHRRLRRVVRPFVVCELLLPPLHPPGREVDGDDRIGARVRAGADRRIVERGRRAGAEVERVRRRVDGGRRPDHAAAHEAPESAPARPLRRNRPERVRPGRREVGVVRHHEAADAVLGAGGAQDQPVVGADGSARLRVAVARGRARDRLGDRYAPLELARRRVERDDRHVQRQDEDVAVAEGDAAVRDDAEVAEDGDVVRGPTPLHLARRRVEGEDVVVVRRHVDRPVLHHREGLLPAADRRVDDPEVDREDPAELADVVLCDLRQRRVPVLVRGVAEAAPADVPRRPGPGRGGREQDPRKRCHGQQGERPDEVMRHPIENPMPARAGCLERNATRAGRAASPARRSSESAVR